MAYICSKMAISRLHIKINRYRVTKKALHTQQEFLALNDYLLDLSN